MSTVSRVTPQEITDFKRRSKSKKELKVTRRILSFKELFPETKVQIGKTTFYFSRVITRGPQSQLQVMMYYSKGKSRILPRALYKSRSHGGWRSCPGNDVTLHVFKKRPRFTHHSKGFGIHYTQETKVALPLVLHLNNIEKEKKVFYDSDLPGSFFDLSDNKKHAWYTYEKETKLFDDEGLLKEFQKIKPGHLTKKEHPKENIAQTFSDFNFEKKGIKKFLPDFSKKPIKSFSLKHSLLGKINLNLYEAELRKRRVHWIIAYDTMLRVWIDHIYFPDSQINSYGICSEFIDSGALTNKPLEYPKQITALKSNDFKKFEHSKYYYVDISPLLKRLKPIRDFIKQIDKTKL